MALNKDLYIKFDYISKMVYYYFTSFHDRKMIKSDKSHTNTQSNVVLSFSSDSKWNYLYTSYCIWQNE